jgi:hypothetical protein
MCSHLEKHVYNAIQIIFPFIFGSSKIEYIPCIIMFNVEFNVEFNGFTLRPIVHATLFTLQNNVYMLSSHHVEQISH